MTTARTLGEQLTEDFKCALRAVAEVLGVSIEQVLTLADVPRDEPWTKAHYLMLRVWLARQASQYAATERAIRSAAVLATDVFLCAMAAETEEDAAVRMFLVQSAAANASLN